MFRILLGPLAVILVLGMTACGPKDATQEGTTTAPNGQPATTGQEGGTEGEGPATNVTFDEGEKYPDMTPVASASTQN